MGFEVVVFERASEIGEVGAGLLLAANAQKARGEAGEGTLRLGAEMGDFGHEEGGVTVSLDGGGEERTDLLVGADGLRSRARAPLFGPAGPRYAGYTAWRAVVERGEELLPRVTGFESWGRDDRFGCANIGGGRIY